MCSSLPAYRLYDKAGKSVLMRPAKLLLNNNFSGKPEDIYLFTGARPQAAFGNSTQWNSQQSAGRIGEITPERRPVKTTPSE